MSNENDSSCHVHAVIQVKPGKSNEFMNIMRELKKLLEHEFGVKLAGTYQAKAKPEMFVNIWSIPSQEVLTRFASETHDIKLVQELETCIESEQVEVVGAIF